MLRRRPLKSRPTVPKDTILISHAIEDNEFTLWLALQLAKEGYRVWCDLTKLCEQRQRKTGQTQFQEITSVSFVHFSPAIAGGRIMA
jgi:hypothetical protein